MLEGLSRVLDGHSLIKEDLFWEQLEGQMKSPSVSNRRRRAEARLRRPNGCERIGLDWRGMDCSPHALQAAKAHSVMVRRGAGLLAGEHGCTDFGGSSCGSHRWRCVRYVPCSTWILQGLRGRSLPGTSGVQRLQVGMHSTLTGCIGGWSVYGR